MTTPLALRVALAGLGLSLAATTDLPRYDRTLELETTSETSANASFGDLDGDGNLDIVLAKGRHWPLVDKVLMGDGHGGIRETRDLGVASDKSYSGRVVDLDGDGDLDVVISNDAPSPKLVYLNDGTGHFVVGAPYGKPEWQGRNATVADMNGDGKPDIIAANRASRAPFANYICLNNGDGTFASECIAFSPEPATTITAADFNRDGLLDLVVPHRNGGQSRLYLGAKNADLAHLRSVAFGPSDARIRISEAADFDGNGTMDLVVIDEGTGVAIYPGRGDGTFAAPRPIGDKTVVPYALTVGDPNCDGKADFIVGNVNAPSTAWFNDGAGTRFTPVSFGDNKGTAYGIAIGDFDNDGRPDIAVARSDAPNMLYFASGPVGRCPATAKAGVPRGSSTRTPTSAVTALVQGDRQVINPPGISPLVPAYSVAIRDGDLIFVSGMTGIKPGTQDIIDGGIAAQTRQTLENIKTAMQSGGGTMADIAECTVFLKDMADYAAMNGVYQEYFRVDPPARATLSVTALPRPAALVEIKCSGRLRKR